MKTFRVWTWVLLLGIAGHSPGWTIPGTASAQEPGDDLIEITLVLVNNGARPTVLRRSRVEPRNVVLLDSATMDARQLSDAVLGLLIAEASDPQGRGRADHAASRVRIDQQRPVYPWTTEALVQLRAAAARPIPGVGRHRSLEVRVARLRSAVPGS